MGVCDMDIRIRDFRFRFGGVPVAAIGVDSPYGFWIRWTGAESPEDFIPKSVVNLYRLFTHIYSLEIDEFNLNGTRMASFSRDGKCTWSRKALV